MDSLLPILHKISIVILPLLFAITLHEAAHGYVAAKLGDKTALMMGRVTLNPAKHIDPIGTIVLPLAMLLLKTGFIFGWAKPVPVTWQNLNHPRRDMAWVALAGPGANLLMAILWAAIVKVSITLLPSTQGHTVLQQIAVFAIAAGSYGIFINFILMILNLIPIPPLDGSRVVSAILPPRMAARYEVLEPYGIWILLALLFFGLLQSIIIPPLILLMHWITIIFHLPVNPMLG